jgi:hypothetical protein
MDTRQIICCLRDVGSFLGVFASYKPPQYPILRYGTLIVITDPHTESGSHWLAIHIQSRSSRLYCFDSYGLPPYIAAIQSFINRNCTVWDYNMVQLQGSTTTVCGKYCCLLGLYRDRGYSPQKFAGLLSVGSMQSDRRVSELFKAEFGPLPRVLQRNGQCNTSLR